MIKTKRPILSVVVCFKDWGLERLEGVTRSIQESGMGSDLEVIISDYGSSDSKGYEERLSSMGARYFYFETNGVWSRSRALNLGLQKARGEYLVTTDSDMVFTPETFPRIVEMMRKDKNSYFILQCRDLPEGITHEDIFSKDVDWERLEALSKLRPRWGMGGLIAFHRRALRETRGLDERLEIYGGEDIDLARRLMRTGLKRIWVTDPSVRMFHVWHPSSRTEADKTPEGARAIKLNRNIQLYDASIARNLKSWGGKPDDSEPLVTVAISTFNRAEFLGESIASVLGQSFKDFELIVVDDGSTDDTQKVLASFSDPRIRVVEQENRGLAAARNRITDLARGKYVAVHDDDDIMLPNRLERQLQAITTGVNGTYGGWIDFDNETGEKTFNRGKRFSVESLLFNHGIYLHPTLMIQTRILKAVRYDETMRSGSDYNLAVRLARAGANLVHCSEYVTLRRTHDGQITNAHGIFQKVSGRVTNAYGRSNMTIQELQESRTDRGKKDWVKVVDEESIDGLVTGLLPDHLAGREIVLRFDLKNKELLERALQSVSWRNEIAVTKHDETEIILDSGPISWMELQQIYREVGSLVDIEVNPLTMTDEKESEKLPEKSSFRLLEGIDERVLAEIGRFGWATKSIADVASGQFNNQTVPEGIAVVQVMSGGQSEKVFFVAKEDSLGQATASSRLEEWVELKNLDVAKFWILEEKDR